MHGRSVLFAHIVCMEVALSFGIPGCGMLNYLGEVSEGKERRSGRERSTRPAEGISKGHSFTLTSTTVTDWLRRAVWMCQRMTTWVVCLLHSPRSCLCASVTMATPTDYRDMADTPITGFSESSCGLWLQAHLLSHQSFLSPLGAELVQSQDFTPTPYEPSPQNYLFKCSHLPLDLREVQKVTQFRNWKFWNVPESPDNWLWNNSAPETEVMRASWEGRRKILMAGKCQIPNSERWPLLSGYRKHVLSPL